MLSFIQSFQAIKLICEKFDEDQESLPGIKVKNILHSDLVW